MVRRDSKVDNFADSLFFVDYYYYYYYLIFISKSFRTIVFVFIVFFHNVSAAVSSGLPEVSLVYLDIEMIQPGKSFLKIESFLCPDKQGTPEEGRRIQRPKGCEKTIKTKAIVRKLLLIKTIKLRL